MAATNRLIRDHQEDNTWHNNGFMISRFADFYCSRYQYYNRNIFYRPNCFGFTNFRLMAWNSPFLSTLSGTDTDALQSIFSSLRGELERLQLEIDDLKNKPANKFKEQTRY